MTALGSSVADKPARAGRTRLFLSATIGFGAARATVRVRDLSASGARIEGENLPVVGASTTMDRGALTAGGTIIWREHKAAGLRFDQPLELDRWMPGLVARDPEEAEKSVADPLGPSTGTAEAMLRQRLTEELDYVARLLESLGTDLVRDPLIRARYGQQLENLGMSAQILGHVGAVLVADDPQSAVNAIGLQSLRKRLGRTQL